MLEDLSIIEVNIEGSNPRAVHQRLSQQIQVIIDECMKSLMCFTAVRYNANKNTKSDDLVLDEETFLIPLKQIRSVIDSHSVLNRPGGRRLLSETECKNYFKEWIGGRKSTIHYDVFLSYRWGALDSGFVRCVYDRFSLYTMGNENREIHVFLDRECLQIGRFVELNIII